MNSFTHRADKSRATVVTMSYNKRLDNRQHWCVCQSSALYLDHKWKVKHNPV